MIIIIIIKIFLKPYSWYRSDFPTSQNVAQGHFKVGSHAQTETRAWLVQKNACSCLHFLIGAPHAKQ